jgi:DNA-binding NtrC family response regulator
MKNLFIIDSNDHDSLTAKTLLTGRYNLTCFRSAAEAYREGLDTKPELVLMDMAFTSAGGLLNPVEAFVSAGYRPGMVCVDSSPELPVIVASIRQGASEFLGKPYTNRSLTRALGMAASDHHERLSSPAAVRDQTTKARSLGFAHFQDMQPDNADYPVADGSLLGDSALMCEVRKKIHLFARFDASVLILGESGTGKELAAAAIHRASARSTRNFIPLDCASIPETLAESRLFGTVKGAYTDASDSPGVFEAAAGGTLFLDEIGELHLGVQSKLLRVLESRKASRLGSVAEASYNVRILSATDANLYDDPLRFRRELLHRLNTLVLTLPPLRSHPEDIALIAREYLRVEMPDKRLHPDAITKLTAWRWPGNVRELRNTLFRAAVYADRRSEILARDIETLGGSAWGGMQGSFF